MHHRDIRTVFFLQPTAGLSFCVTNGGKSSRETFISNEFENEECLCFQMWLLHLYIVFLDNFAELLTSRDFDCRMTLASWSKVIPPCEAEISGCLASPAVATSQRSPSLRRHIVRPGLKKFSPQVVQLQPQVSKNLLHTPMRTASSINPIPSVA